jgi:thymidylate synthase
MPYDDTTYYDDLNENSQPGRTQYPNHVDRQFQEHLQIILDEGHESDDRTGSGTLKYFGRQMRFDLQEGFPLLTTKAVHFPSIARELLWFLRGRTNIWHLLQDGVSIWTGDAYRRYKQETMHNPFGKEAFERRVAAGEKLSDNQFAQHWGDLGEIYGARWRNAGGFDQIENLVRQLQDSPDSRRLRVDAWKPSVHMKGAPDEDEATLPPCHCSFQVFTRERPDGNRGLSLKWTQRSVDSFLGLPFNIASYALLTHMLAQQTNMVAEEVIFQGGDCHLYKPHLDQAREQISRVGRSELPTLNLPKEPPADLKSYHADDITVENYDPHPAIGASLCT